MEQLRGLFLGIVRIDGLGHRFTCGLLPPSEISAILASWEVNNFNLDQI
jgi:hypothetical protein